MVKVKQYRFAILAFSFLLIATFACGGYGLAYEKDLVGKYAVWAVDAPEEAAVVEKIGSSSAGNIVPAMVFSYGWNKKFIIAKQHPRLGDDPFVVDVTKTNWFIVEVTSGNVHGPLTEDEYIELRQKLGVPAKLIFTDIIEPSNKPKTPTGKPK